MFEPQKIGNKISNIRYPDENSNSKFTSSDDPKWKGNTIPRMEDETKKGGIEPHLTNARLSHRGL